MQQNLQNYWNEMDCQTMLCEPSEETLKTIMRFAAMFRSIPISKNCSLNYVLN